jgi:tetratricopeptide (TPR) repeat protein
MPRKTKTETATGRSTRRRPGRKLNQQLNTLEGSGLIRVAQMTPELEYLFRHALIQDAAYGSMLKTDRRNLHRTVGETLERLYPDQQDELAAVLALHFAAAEDHPKAIAYFRRAARHAIGRYAYEEGLQHLEAALDLLPIGPEPDETRPVVLEELADTHRFIRNTTQALRFFRAALDQWERLPASNEASLIRLHCKILETFSDGRWGMKSEQAEALAPAIAASRVYLESKTRQLEADPPQVDSARALTALAYDAWKFLGPPNWAPDWERAEHYALAATRLADKLEAPQARAAALDALANAHYGHGRLREHLQTTLQRLVVTRQPGLDNLREQVDTLGGVGNALVHVGEYTQAMPYILEEESLSHHIRAVDRHIHALSLQSQCWFRLDHWEDLFQIDDKRRDLEEQYSLERVGATCFEIGLSAATHALRGELEQAQQLRQQAYGIMTSVNGNPKTWPRNAHY